MVLQGMYTSNRLFELVIRTSLQPNLTLNKNSLSIRKQKGNFYDFKYYFKALQNLVLLLL